MLMTCLLIIKSLSGADASRLEVDWKTLRETLQKLILYVDINRPKCNQTSLWLNQFHQSLFTSAVFVPLKALYGSFDLEDWFNWISLIYFVWSILVHSFKGFISLVFPQPPILFLVCLALWTKCRIPTWFHAHTPSCTGIIHVMYLSFNCMWTRAESTFTESSFFFLTNT